MSTLKIILQIIQAIPTLLKLWKEWELAKLRRVQAEEAERMKKEIDRGIEEKDQRPIEEALGHSEPGAPAKDREGVQTRPSKERL